MANMGLDILLHCLQRNQRGVANRAHWSLRWNLASIVDRARQVYDQYLKELVVRVKEGIAEDTAIELPNEEVERLIDAHVPASWRSLSPSEADAQWLREVQRKEKET